MVSVMMMMVVVSVVASRVASSYVPRVQIWLLPAILALQLIFLVMLVLALQHIRANGSDD